MSRVTRGDDQTRWYFVCECNAKFFADRKQVCCPRCGQLRKSRERIVPPWRRHPPRQKMSLSPYYEDNAVRIFHGDCREVLPQLDERFELVLTDPPYSERTHRGARTSRFGMQGKRLVDFEHLTVGEIRDIFGELAKHLSGWLVSFTDWRYTPALAEPGVEGLRFVRFGIWVKPNGAPQFSGDRPGMGWEAIALMHTETKPLSWNGGGRHAVWTMPRAHKQWHPTEKPLGLVRELMCNFANEGDLVLDPFMGSGTTLRAAKDLGCRAIGIEIDERWCEYAANRLSQQVLF